MSTDDDMIRKLQESVEASRPANHPFAARYYAGETTVSTDRIWTAAIDASWHGAKIEIHDPDQRHAEAIRDALLAILTKET